MVMEPLTPPATMVPPRAAVVPASRIMGVAIPAVWGAVIRVVMGPAVVAMAAMEVVPMETAAVAIAA